MKIGGTDISSIKVGSTPVTKVMNNGATLWQAGPPEMISNGTFSDGSSWSAAAGWVITGGNPGYATYDDVTDGAKLRQSDADMISSIKPNTSYKLEFDITIISGNAMFYRISDYGNGVGYITNNPSYGAGHHIVNFTTPADVGIIKGICFNANDGTSQTFRISNISLKENL